MLPGYPLPHPLPRSLWEVDSSGDSQQGSDPPQNLRQQCLSIGERSDSKLQNQDLSSWKGSLLMIKPRWAIVVSLSLLRSVFHSRRKTKKVHILRAKLNQSTVLQMCKCRSIKEPWRNKTNKQKQKKKNPKELVMILFCSNTKSSAKLEH